MKSEMKGASKGSIPTEQRGRGATAGSDAPQLFFLLHTPALLRHNSWQPTREHATGQRLHHEPVAAEILATTVVSPCPTQNLPEAEQEASFTPFALGSYLVCQGSVQQVACLCMDESLGCPGTPRGVEHEEHVLAAHAFGGTHRGLLGHLLEGTEAHDQVKALYPLPHAKALDTTASLAEVRSLRVTFSVHFKCKDTKR